MKEPPTKTVPRSAGQCLCGTVRFDIEIPAFWAWNDHARPSRVAHGAAYATYVGTWRKRLRILAGSDAIVRYEDTANRQTRSFCGRCGTPLFFERGQSRPMVNIPRALFDERVGRQPIYHHAIDELRDWTWTGAPLVPLKGYPGYTHERRRRSARPPTAAYTDDDPGGDSGDDDPNVT